MSGIPCVIDTKAPCWFPKALKGLLQHDGEANITASLRDKNRKVSVDAEGEQGNLPLTPISVSFLLPKMFLTHGAMLPSKRDGKGKAMWERGGEGVSEGEREGRVRSKLRQKMASGSGEFI